MISIVKYLKIKDLFSLMNALCGFTALGFAVHNQPVIASVLIFLGAIFDYLDGAIARATNLTAFGKELDSLCDTVTFGVAPAFIIYNILVPAVGIYVSVAVAFIYLAAGVVRLARFNITKQINFTGLPIPAAALFVTFMVMAGIHMRNPTWFIPSSLVLAFLMISDFAYVSQKEAPSHRIVINSSIVLLIYFTLYARNKRILSMIGMFMSLLYIISPIVGIKHLISVKNMGSSEDAIVVEGRDAVEA